MTDGLLVGRDGKSRCCWCKEDDYILYHDEEWGRPGEDDTRLFEKVCLEGFQAGLSWLTILRKREPFRRAFDGFDMHKVARFTPARVEKLLLDPGIVRHRGKIEAAIHNAARAIELVDNVGSLAKYFWSFEPKPATRPKAMTLAALKQLTETDESRALSKDLRRRGFKFVGPTTMYAHMQAMGIVNDHLDGCYVRRAVETERKAFRRP